MTKKDPVLWVVVDKDGTAVRVGGTNEVAAKRRAEWLRDDYPKYAPYRVVKYLPAPKKRKKA